MRFLFRLTAYILIALLVQSCLVHPNYCRPPLEVPETWRISVDESSSYANCRWWEQFGDPVLNSLIKEALENNRDLKVAISRVYEFYGNLMIARSELYPQINVTTERLRQHNSIATGGSIPGTPRTFNEFILLFNGSYDLDIWGKIRSASEAALAQLLASIEARRVVVSTLVTSVATSYILLRQYDKQLQISEQTLKSRQESYNIANARYHGGLTSELDARQAEADVESAAVELTRYEILIAQQENDLSVLIGHPPQAIVRGLSLDDLALPLDVPAGIPSEVLNQRPDILEAEQKLIAANAEIGVAQAQFFPDITLTGYFGNESFHLKDWLTSPAQTWQYAITLLQPLFTGGLLTGQLEVAEAQKYEAYYAYQQTVLVAFKEVEDALISHQKTKEIVNIQKRRVTALKEALHLATLQYNNGEVDYLNVLDAERNLFAAQLDLARFEADTFSTIISLYKALGGGWIADSDNQALQPKNGS